MPRGAAAPAAPITNSFARSLSSLCHSQRLPLYSEQEAGQWFSGRARVQAWRSCTEMFQGSKGTAYETSGIDTQGQQLRSRTRPRLCPTRGGRNVRSKIQAGVLSGVVQAGAFHPWDRALYLAQTHSRSFLHPLNWITPLQGMAQTLLLRVLSSSSFFMLEESLTPLAAEKLGEGRWAHFVAGNLAGGITAAALNPIQAARYKSFSLRAMDPKAPADFISTCRGMAQAGGAQPFFRGIGPTLGRDLVFGGIFTLLRKDFAARMVPACKAEEETAVRFACDVVAAAVATTASAPFNYARNLMYAAPAGAAASTFTVLQDLATQTAAQGSTLASLQFLQQRLKIGPATLRVALSMALASSTYYWWRRRETDDPEAATEAPPPAKRP